MTPRKRFIRCLEGGFTPGLVPHFELVFYLTMECFGRVHPRHRNYRQWQQMSETERRLHRADMASVYVQIADELEHSAIFANPNPNTLDEALMLLEEIRRLSDDRYFLMMHGDATFAIPSGEAMVEFTYRMADDPESMKDEAQARVDAALERARRLQAHGALDGFALCADYCFNSGPFLSPALFDEFISPYLQMLIREYRSMGFYTIKHTDGNIMPILDRLVDAQPHALHSLDPQGGVDIAEVKRRVGDRVCLIGNVNCGLLQTGTEAEIVESVRYALHHAMPGGGYIFSTSNCVYPGMPLSSYRLMTHVWREEGVYDG
jgi:uroporphyrinogen decarboxylase